MAAKPPDKILSILRITDAKTLELIDLCKKEKCLWDTSHEDFPSKAKRALAAQKIAKILNIPGFTGKNVMEKFTNIRNSYNRKQKKINESIASGAKGEQVYKPRVFWYSKLDAFIRPHLYVRPRKQQETFICRQDPKNDQEWMLLSHPKDPLKLEPSTPLVDCVSPTPPPPSDSDDDLSNDSCKRRKLDSPTNAASSFTTQTEEQKSVSQTLEDIQSDLKVLMSNDDHYDAFGKYIASLLRMLPSQKALALQPHIVSLITTAIGNDRKQSVGVEGEEDSLGEVLVKIERN